MHLKPQIIHLNLHEKISILTNQATSQPTNLEYSRCMRPRHQRAKIARNQNSSPMNKIEFQDHGWEIQSGVHRP